ncbi:hypothetical protein AYL99_09600 [Fonsecaea erecta]|uniref:Uncharacterized protein n=1 Tax=Fonsecaea erecta TaxID=1367422 RepID=A0A178ZAC9_9EURO|nr:hypothetical protein AYL99_09600 [Fonsecaea erecta]OAP56421.1 hypothetical protein AYL99_09600 [Fonsecaea erecta]
MAGGMIVRPSSDLSLLARFPFLGVVAVLAHDVRDHLSSCADRRSTTAGSLVAPTPA